MASYAARITEELDVSVDTQTGTRGQFDVIVNGEIVVSRKGGLLALVTRKPWPSETDVVSAVRQALQ